MSDRAAILGALRALLPTGAALPREPSSPFGALIDVHAAELALVTSRAERLLEEADPRATQELFEEWERLAGLPDDCQPIERFRRDSLAWWFDGTGTLRQAAAGELRRPPLGRPSDPPLIEPRRINLVRNPRAEGAAVGSPGTAPTFWAFGGGGGASVQIVGVGSDRGVPYVDFRLTGPAGSGRFALVQFETATSTPVTPGDVLAGSYYAALVAVAAGGIDIHQIGFSEFTAGGTYLGETRSTVPLPSAAWQRPVHVNPIANAGAQRVLLQLTVGLSTAATDVTIRLALPQLERGGSASSPILPAIGTPISTVREADEYSVAGIAERRARVLARLTQRPGQSRAFFIGLAASLGATPATITEYRQTDVEAGCETPLLGEDWVHAWQMNLPGSAAVSLADCEDGCELPLAQWSSSSIECVLRDFAPAHTTLLFAYA
jgi:uncharacterized protein YmfQ (DUF2313 family)